MRYYDYTDGFRMQTIVVWLTTYIELRLSQILWNSPKLLLKVVSRSVMIVIVFILITFFFL